MIATACQAPVCRHRTEKLKATALGIRKLNLGATGGRIEFIDKPQSDSDHSIKTNRDTTEWTAPATYGSTAEPDTRIDAVRGDRVGLSGRPSIGR